MKILGAGPCVTAADEGLTSSMGKRRLESSSTRYDLPGSLTKLTLISARRAAGGGHFDDVNGRAAEFDVWIDKLLDVFFI